MAELLSNKLAERHVLMAGLVSKRLSGKSIWACFQWSFSAPSRWQFTPLIGSTGSTRLGQGAEA
jgi:hypothetical protein